MEVPVVDFSMILLRVVFVTFLLHILRRRRARPSDDKKIKKTADVAGDIDWQMIQMNDLILYRV